jgi:signal recognition particle receptor subunit beta
VFVADSQAERLEANLISMDDLLDNLSAYGFDVEKIPFVIQYNKRDLPNALPVDVLRSELNQWYPKVPDFEAVASDGTGVFECLKEVTKMILSDLRKNGK